MIERFSSTMMMEPQKIIFIDAYSIVLCSLIKMLGNSFFDDVIAINTWVMRTSNSLTEFPIPLLKPALYIYMCTIHDCRRQKAQYGRI